MPAKRAPSSIHSSRGGAPPVEVKLPNQTTRAAMRRALEDEDLTAWADLEELKATHG
jgi:hypothetical protein